MASVVPQLFVWEKSPEAAMLVILRLSLPVFVSVACKGALVLPWFWLPKSRLAGESDTADAWPAPVSVMV